MLNLRLTPLLITALLSFPVTLSATVEDLPETSEQNNASAAQGEQGYIKDDLFIYVHTGPGKRFRILGSIDAGTAIEKLGEDQESGYIQIKDDKGRIGWIDQTNFTADPGIRQQMAEMQNQFNNLQQQVDENQSAKEDALAQLDNARRDADAFGKTVAELEQEKLQLQERIDKLENQKSQKTLLYGAGILFGGLLFGLIVPSLIPRRRRQDKWL